MVPRIEIFCTDSQVIGSLIRTRDFGNINAKLVSPSFQRCLAKKTPVTSGQSKSVDSTSKNASNIAWISSNSLRISGTQNGGTEPYKAIWGAGFPLHKPYIQLI